MILGILLVCTLEGDCMPIPNTGELYETIEDCQAHGSEAMQNIPAHFNTRLFCYETDFFEAI